jgi:DNA polymerase-3 subunit delta'
VTRLDEIRGQAVAVELLSGVLDTGRIPHALLFHGPAGVGKATAARAFAAALLCEHAQERAACARCASCRLLESGTHPDFLRVGRLTRKEVLQKEKSRLDTHVADATEGELVAWIRVDQIRRLNELVGLRPRQSPRRVFVVDPADRMNRESQNALLKTLEEPPARSVLVLVTTRPHVLLSTVRSRCFQVGFRALGRSELCSLLEARGIPREEATSRAALSGGSLGRALELELDARIARRREVCAMLEDLSSPSPALDRLPAMAAALAGKDEPTLLDGLELLESLLRDAARAGIGGAPPRLAHADLAEATSAVARRISPARAARLISSVERLRGDLRTNTNRLLIAEALLAAVADGPLP